MSGTPVVFGSPCGANCTYNYQFDAPTFKCSEKVIEHKAPGLSQTLSPDSNVIYDSNWYFFNEHTCSAPPNMNLSRSRVSRVPYNISDLQNWNASILLTETSLVCRPYRSTYIVTNSYLNGKQTLEYMTTNVEQLPCYDLDGMALVLSGTSYGNDSSARNYSGIQNSPELRSANYSGIHNTLEVRSTWSNAQMMGIVNAFAANFVGSVYTIQDNYPDLCGN